jgi:hypothetical protein
MALCRIKASLGPTGRPHLTTLRLTGLTDDRPVYSDTDDTLQSVTLGTSLTFTAPTLNTIQGIRTVDSPEFVGLTLSGLTADSVLFAGTGGVVSQDNANLHWDNVNKRLSIGAHWALRPLVVINSGEDAILIRDTNTDAASTLGFGVNTTSGYAFIQSFNDDYDGGTIQPLTFWVGTTRAITIATDGKVGIGANTPAERLDLGSGNLITTGIVNASAGKVLVTDNDTVEPTGQSDGYIGVAIVGGQPRIYFRVAGEMYYVEGSVSMAVATGNPIGLLLTLTYNLE